MSNPFEQLSKSVSNPISADPAVTDGSAIPAFNPEGPSTDEGLVEVTQAQIREKLNSIDEAKASRLAKWTNEAELVALAAKAPNTAKYVVETLGIKSTEVVKGPQEEIGKVYPIKLPKNPSQSFDGFIIKTPEGPEVTIHKDSIQEWLIENTLGYIIGGDKGFELAIVENNKGKRKNPYRVQRIGISNSNPEHMRDTFQPAVEDGKPVVTSRTVNLDPGVELRDVDDKLVQLRGKIEGFPVFERQTEYLDALGVINRKTRGPVGSSKDRKEALNKYAEMLVRMEASQI